MSDILISLRNITFSFSKKAFIENLNVDIPNHSIYGFLGANGSGKTTIIKLMTGMLTPHSGEVYYQNQNLSIKKNEILQSVGILLEKPFLYPFMTGLESLQYLCKLYQTDYAAIPKVVELIGLSHKDLTKKVSAYSLGMQQRLGLAPILLKKAKIIILDEPTNGLDPIGIAELRRLIFVLKEEGKTIIISSHLLNEIEHLCTHLCIFDDGKKLLEMPANRLKNTNDYWIKVDHLNAALELLLQMEIQATLEKDNYLCIANCKEDILNKILKGLVSQQITILDVEKSKNNLENIYLKLHNNKNLDSEQNKTYF